MRRKFDVSIDSAVTAVDALASRSGLPKQRIKDAMAKGACWWTHKGKQVRLRKAKRELKPGTRIQLFYDDQVLARQPEAATLLENKGRYSVWFKPHGLLSQGSQWGDHCSLLRLAELELNHPCFLVHRLDADAAGLMLIAHDGKAAAALSALFSGRFMTKIYHAQVTGTLNAKDLRIDQPIDGKASVSYVTTLDVNAATDTTLVEVRIDTGRKHQIRRHLAGIGHSILGDRLYGTRANPELQLVARYLSFDCPLLRQPVAFSLAPETESRPA